MVINGFTGYLTTLFQKLYIALKDMRTVMKDERVRIIKNFLDITHRPNLITTRHFGDRLQSPKRHIVIKMRRWTTCKKLIVLKNTVVTNIEV